MMEDRKRLVVLAIGFLAVAAAVVWIIIRTNDMNELANPSEEDTLTEELFAMDTVMDITLYRTAQTDQPLRDIFTEMRDRIYQMERDFSVTDEKSVVSKLNQASGSEQWTPLSDEEYEMIDIAERISLDTDKAFDPTMFPIVKLWGFTTGEFRIPKEDEIRETLKKVGIDNIESDVETKKVRLNNGAQVDLGACAKGFLSDKLRDIMNAHHVNGILSLGGNVQTVGTKPDGTAFVVGISNPSDPNTLYATLESRDEAVITSGNYQRYFEQDGKRYHHIFDPKTGAPAESGLSSVTVIGEKGVYCDALATAFFVMGEEKTKEYLNKNELRYKVILIREDGSSWNSEDLKLTIKK